MKTIEQRWEEARAAARKLEALGEWKSKGNMVFPTEAQFAARRELELALCRLSKATGMNETYLRNRL